MFLRRVATSAIILVALALIGFTGNNIALTLDQTEYAYNTHNLVRLHILANSDSRIDQEIKYQVRDAVLAETKRLFTKADGVEQALELARANQDDLVRLATGIVRKAGADYGAVVTVGDYDFPAKTYPFGTLPAGRYKAVRIVLGEGEGHNWWCVLFPPLCFDQPETLDPGKPIQVHIAFLEHLLGQVKAEQLESLWQSWTRWLKNTAVGPI